MTGLQVYSNVLLVLEALALAGVLAKFLTTGLYRVYRYFFVYLLLELLQLGIPLVAQSNRAMYAYLYLATESLIVCFYALVVLELYSLILRNLAGLASTARLYIKVALGIAIAASVVLLQFEQISDGILPRFYTFERTIVSSLVFFVILITAFLVYYPAPLNRNLIFYSIGYALYFLNKAIALFMRNSFPDWDAGTDIAVLTGSTALLVFWMFSLSREGEIKSMVVNNNWSRDDQEKLLRQLQSINSSLLRARK